jgi:hypothetical protein
VHACRTVTLPVGLWRDGEHHRAAALRGLTGEEEELVRLELSAAGPRGRVASRLLARCVARIGSLAPVTEALAEELAVGDREALLLELRRLTFGDRLAALADCRACGEALDLDLAVTGLLVPPAPDPRPELTTELEAEGSRWKARFRRPTGADQAAAAARPASAGPILLARCVSTLERADGVRLPPAEAPAGVALALERLLAESDPQAEIRLDVACPVCGEAFAASLDAADYLFRELLAEGDRLYREVAAVARAFHWREADILALPRARRQAYAALAADR